MSGFECINTIYGVSDFLLDSNSINVPSLPYFSGSRVNCYYDMIKICYGLILQKQFLSRDTIVFKFVGDDRILNTSGLVDILHVNWKTNGLYNTARKIQKTEVNKWFCNKEKVSICFLPMSKEYETTNLGCAVLFLEILENAGLIDINRKNQQ